MEKAVFCFFALIMGGLSQFIVGPILSQHLVAHNSGLYLRTDPSFSTVSLDAPFEYSQEFRLSIQYHIQTEEGSYYIKISPFGWTTKYLTESFSDVTILEGGGGEAASKHDYRLHKSNLQPDYTMTFAVDNSYTSIKYLYDNSGSPGYRTYLSYPWLILDASTYTGGVHTLFSALTLQEVNQASSSVDQRRQGSRDRVGDRLYLVFRKHQQIVKMKARRQLNGQDLTAVRIYGYTGYTGVQSFDRATGNITYTTEKMVVVYQPASRRYLTPLITSEGKLSIAGQWSNTASTSQEQVEYGLIFGKQLSAQQLRFITASEQQGLPPILTRDVREQRFPDERFFYARQQGQRNEYTLELAYQRDFYLAMLKIGNDWTLVATRLRQEQAGLITFTFSFDAPPFTMNSDHLHQGF